MFVESLKCTAAMRCVTRAASLRPLHPDGNLHAASVTTANTFHIYSYILHMFFVSISPASGTSRARTDRNLFFLPRFRWTRQPKRGRLNASSAGARSSDFQLLMWHDLTKKNWNDFIDLKPIQISLTSMVIWVFKFMNYTQGSFLYFNREITPSKFQWNNN